MNVLEGLAVIAATWAYWDSPVPRATLLVWALAVITLILARVSWLLLGRPLRNGDREDLRKVSLSVLATSVAMGIGGFLFNPTDTLLSESMLYAQLTMSSLGTCLLNKSPSPRE